MNELTPNSCTSGEVVHLNKFHFDSLRKYMQPLYSELVRNENKPKDEKHKIKSQVLAEFLRRLRVYRGKTISELAEKFNLNCQELEQAEGGKVEISTGPFMAYIKGCYGEREFSYFSEKLREFHDPSIRLSKLAVAHDALKRFGIVITGVDYKSLHAQKGQLLKFSPVIRSEK